MKNSQGISLIALVVTIIVMIILAAMAVRVSTSGIDKTVEAAIVNEKKELETAIIKRFGDFALNEMASPLIGSVVGENEIEDIEGISMDNIDYIRRVNKSNIQLLGVKNTTGNEYIVDYLAGKVYGPVN